jgi:hypothetical protein
MRYLDGVYRVFDDLKTARPDEVDASASRLGVTFPAGYRDYVTELGEGTLSGYLRLWLPSKLEGEQAELRRMFGSSFFWDEDGPITSKVVDELVFLGDTMVGDHLVFHPSRPDDLFVLPRHQDRIYPVGPGLEAAIDWLCDSGVLTRVITCRYFEPPGERDTIARTIPLPFLEVRDALIDLEIHDHVAFEESPDDDDQVFEVMFQVDDGDFEEAEGDASIMLLVKEFGGNVFASNDATDPGSTEIIITHVPGCESPKLDRLLAVLDELAG